VTTNQILIGVGLILVLAVGAQVLASRLRITRPARTRPLLAGGSRWVIDLGQALRSAGLEVLMWAGPATGMLPAGHDLLFLVRADGQLAPVTRTGTPAPEAGDTAVSLGPSGVAAIGPVDVP
jgi:hypothetical protein